LKRNIEFKRKIKIKRKDRDVEESERVDINPKLIVEYIKFVKF
jgi:hypothetical protein